MVEFPKPGAEHLMLRRLTGVWTARTKHYSTPGRPPNESTGQFLARMDLGGYFLCRDVNFGMQGFQGRGITGYDPLKRTYVGTWMDSTSPWIYRTEGRFDELGNYCEVSEGSDPRGNPIRMRLTTKMPDPNQMLFRMHRLDDSGAESIMVEIEHTRRRFID